MKHLLIFYFLCLSIFFFPNNTAAQDVTYFGVWQKGSGSNLIQKFDKWSDFIAEHSKKRSKGLRLVDFEHFRKSGKNQYVGVWRNGSGKNPVVKFNKWSDFIADGNKKAQKGLRLTDFEHFRASKKNHYVGVWKSGSGSNVIVKFNKWSDFIADGNKKAQKGLRLVDFEYFRTQKNKHYVGVWKNGSGSNIIAKFNSWSKFMADAAQKGKKGLRLADFEYFRLNDKDHFVGVWRSSNKKSEIVKVGKWSTFLADGNKKANKQGLRLVDFEGVMRNATPSNNNGGSNEPSGRYSCDDLPKKPRYINLDRNGSKIIIDFTNIVDGKPRITLPYPIKQYPSFPTCNGEIIFPDNFCGLRITGNVNFQWQDKFGKVIGNVKHNQHPVYNSLPENQDLRDVLGSGYSPSSYVEFSGPIGYCSSSKEGWKFPTPLTKSGKLSPNQSQVKLIIETYGDAKIEFTNEKISYNKPITIDKLFDKHEKRLKSMFKNLKYLDKLVSKGSKDIDKKKKKEISELKAYLRRVCSSMPKACPFKSELFE